MVDNVFFKNQEQIEKYISEELIKKYPIIDDYFVVPLPDYLIKNVEIIFKLNKEISVEQKEDLVDDLYELSHYYFSRDWDIDFVIVSEY
ncbi:hypothetical protein [Methanobrevibacter sp. AbM4]|jgi:hypothetical protein|uniref:hypothetical protein n=1 Tax=Methanobrevibacter sp. AbM4 TaxID=224719 RepID=UPI0003348801|nr:hypothetical protein [Methanobrevibacter sp. AbM4]AGN16954.1 hypothetical protein Abm4_1068 [Methanobrevibacter sp. AbM4]